MYLPEFVQQYKEPRTEIRKIADKFYKYEVAFVYNKDKKRTEKKTVRLLGKITEKEGFVPSKKDELRRKSEELPKVDIKTFGVYHLFSDLMKEEIESLRTTFGKEVAERLLSFAMFRWAYQTPIKRARYYHTHDFCSEFWSPDTLSDKQVSLNLKHVGENRQLAVEWMKSLLKEVSGEAQNFVLMDSTHQISVSENLAVNAAGYNPDFDFDKQIRLMYLFSAQMKQPVYYRLVGGNIPDVKSMSMCISEMDVKKRVVFIADKGFFSHDNLAAMDRENLQYIIPLHRNNTLIDFEILKNGNYEKSLSYFIFQDRIIWHYSYQKDGYQLVTFIDERLRAEEKKDYLKRIQTHPENYTKAGFDEKLHGFGTLTVIYKFDKEEEEEKEEKKTKLKSKKKGAKNPPVFEQVLYESYKQRNEVEVMFDSYKNYLEADASYMQNRYVLEGWLFANFLAMIAYYKLYARLREAELLSKFSPKDMIELSKAICQLKINGKWYRSEMTAKSCALFLKIKIDYLI